MNLGWGILTILLELCSLLLVLLLLCTKRLVVNARRFLIILLNKLGIFRIKLSVFTVLVVVLLKELGITELVVAFSAVSPALVDDITVELFVLPVSSNLDMDDDDNNGGNNDDVGEEDSKMDDQEGVKLLGFPLNKLKFCKLLNSVISSKW